jgi:hypothetical protein
MLVSNNIFYYQNLVEILKKTIFQIKNYLKTSETIKRFNLTYKLAWRTIKIYLKNIGIVVNNLRYIFDNYVFKIGHIYISRKAREIFKKIKEFLLLDFVFLLNKIKNQYKDTPCQLD